MTTMDWPGEGNERKVSKSGATKIWRGPCECSICDHTWQAVVEMEKQHDEPIIPLECPNCGSMTGSPE